LASSVAIGVEESCEKGLKNMKRRRMRQKTALRIHQYRTMKILKMMKSLLKKIKARRQSFHTNYMKKLVKLKKWMDLLNPSLKLNMMKSYMDI